MVTSDLRCSTTVSSNTKWSATVPELALTLLRATGYLSRAELALRPNPAGPLDPLEGPQLQRPPRGRVRRPPAPRRLAFGTTRRRRRRVPAAPRTGPRRRPARARRPPTGQALAVDGAQVSAVLRDRERDALVIRLFNPAPNAATARVEVEGRPARRRRRRPRRTGGRDVLRVGPDSTLGDRHPSSRLTPTWTPRPVSPSTRS